MKTLGKYSIGLGDRFGQQGAAQLKAIIEASEKGTEITPVWNKSNREHIIIGSQPSDVRTEADTVTKKLGFNKPYFVDADHINLETVNLFTECSDFFTIDVASYIGISTEENVIEDFLKSSKKYVGKIKTTGLNLSSEVSKEQIIQIARKYLFAVQKAGEIYRKIKELKGEGSFITEVSMDEVSTSQTSVDLFFILKMLGSENIPVQTIAPRFSGRFNKGVDYAGDPLKFTREFESDMSVIDYAVQEFGLPENLKMSIHSGSDKFSIYPGIGSALKKYNKGIHLKTAGTTWLEEVIGLAESGGEGLEFVKMIYIKSLGRISELCAPYLDVIDINPSSLPAASEAASWSSEKFSSAIKHIPGNPEYNPDMRQLMHVAYKIAAQHLEEYLPLLKRNEQIISECVYENIFNRHICRLFDIQ